jgi:hypothetical protein
MENKEIWVYDYEKFKKIIKKFEEIWNKTEFAGKITSDNLYESIFILLQEHPILFKNEFPELYKNLYILIDLKSINI